MSLVVTLLALVGTSFANTPGDGEKVEKVTETEEGGPSPSEGQILAQRALPLAPVGELKGRVTCTAVVSVGDEGKAKDVGVAAGDGCRGAWARATQDAVSAWAWPTSLSGARGHVTVAWEGDRAAGVTSVTEAKDLDVVSRAAPAMPDGFDQQKRGEVVCRAMVGVTSGGEPAVVAVDSCPSEFQAQAAEALLRWRWEAGEGQGLKRTWTLVSFSEG